MARAHRRGTGPPLPVHMLPSGHRAWAYAGNGDGVTHIVLGKWRDRSRIAIEGCRPELLPTAGGTHLTQWEQSQKGLSSRGREAGNLIATEGARALLSKFFSDMLEPSAGRDLVVLCFPRAETTSSRS